MKINVKDYGRGDGSSKKGSKSEAACNRNVKKTPHGERPQTVGQSDDTPRKKQLNRTALKGTKDKNYLFGLKKISWCLFFSIRSFGRSQIFARTCHSWL